MAGSMDASGEGRTEVKAEWTTDEEASGDARGPGAAGATGEGRPHRAAPGGGHRRRASVRLRYVAQPESGVGPSACNARGRTRLAPPAAAGIFWWASVGLGKG